MAKMTPATLKYHVQNTGSNFFDHKTMRFFGDTMRNYGVTSRPVMVKEYDGTETECWELYRRRPTAHGMTSSAYFCTTTYRRVYPAK